MLNSPRYIILHHTNGTRYNVAADTSHHTIEIVRNWHINGLKFEDIGYHFFIEKDGKVKKGREENYHGAHARGFNRKSLGICLAGNFDIYLPTKKQKDQLKYLLNLLIDKYDIPVNKIISHRRAQEMYYGKERKSCYGSRLNDTWGQELLNDNEKQCEKQAKYIDILVDIILRLVGLKK